MCVANVHCKLLEVVVVHGSRHTRTAQGPPPALPAQAAHKGVLEAHGAHRHRTNREHKGHTREHRENTGKAKGEQRGDTQGRHTDAATSVKSTAPLFCDAVSKRRILRMPG